MEEFDLSWIDFIEDLNEEDIATPITPVNKTALATGEFDQAHWICDTGATDHMTGTQGQKIKPTTATVRIAREQKLKATG